MTVGASGGAVEPGSSGSPAGGGGGSTGSPASGSGSSWQCTNTPLTLNDQAEAPGGPLPGGWFSITCVDSTTGNMVTNTQWISQATPGAAAPAVDPRALALEAEQSLRLPAPQLHVNPSGSGVVNLPTWLWVDPGIWHPDSVAASAAGVTATAVATPRWVVWSMGDGSTVVCDGPGVPYEPSLPPAAQSTTCQHTYLESSAGQPSPDGDPNDASFRVSAAVDWAVAWSATGAPGGGTLPDLTTAATIDERVEQVESLNSVGPGVPSASG